MKYPVTNDEITAIIADIKGLNYFDPYHSKRDWTYNEAEAIKLFMEMRFDGCAIFSSANQWNCSFISVDLQKRTITADSFCVAICLAYIEWREEFMQRVAKSKHASVLRDAAKKLAGGLNSTNPDVLRELMKDVILDLTEAEGGNQRSSKQQNNRN